MRNPLTLDMGFDKFEGDAAAYREAAENAFDDSAAWQTIREYFGGKSFKETEEALEKLIMRAIAVADKETGYGGQYCGGAGAAIYATEFGYCRIALYGTEAEFRESLRKAGIDAEDFEEEGEGL